MVLAAQVGARTPSVIVAIKITASGKIKRESEQVFAGPEIIGLENLGVPLVLEPSLSKFFEF